MSAIQYVQCDRCGCELPERGARLRSEVKLEGAAYKLSTIIEEVGRGYTDLCEVCMAVVLMQYARLIAQDLMEMAARAKPRKAA
jgi:hypothetical protein